MTAFVLRPGTLNLEDLRPLMTGAMAIKADPGCWESVEAAADLVASVARGDKPVYGINTGFGILARQQISPEDVVELQHRLLMSHSTGVGPLLPDSVVRLILILKVNSLARGHSGVRRGVIDALLALLDGGVLPCVPSKGSVGASGDLAPLAHLAGVLIGQGSVRVDGKIIPAVEGLRRVGLEPMALAAKEGLALINGTQVSTSMLIAALLATEDVLAAAIVAGALSVEAAQGSDVPFDPRLAKLSGKTGQADVAKVLRSLLEDSAIRASHLTCERVQDPYSLRCQPQVMGACVDHVRFAADTAARDANAVSDNPLVFPDTGEILSGGNFHAEPTAMAADTLALAISEMGAISERRTALLLDANMSGLPACMVAEPGLNSGFMMAHITAAALASENKSLAHPASVDSLPTSANQEDHVSMAAFAARRLGEMVVNTANIVAIELLTAVQGVDFRKPLTAGPRLLPAIEAIRARVPFLESDRMLAPDIDAVRRLIEDGWFRGLVPLGALKRP
jgi:histidine ammonia-lyase